ncbi:MAG: ABC transporter permease [Lachnospiraceae bacterium]|jgi:hypothetical protein|nr:ABC transporter permease [Lachnospiraceae bacterium]
MKIFHKRILKGNAFLFLSFSAISLCLLLLVSAARAGRENSLMRNNLYSGHQKNFCITGTEENGQWENVIPSLAASGEAFAIYLPVPSQEIPIRGVCLQGEVNLPPMVQGDFFGFSTSWTDSPKMVLGKDFQDEAVPRDGSLSYQLGGREFEVIGIMGTEGDSRANHMIFIDFRSALQMAGINADYKLDTPKPSGIREIGQELCSRFGSSANLFLVLGEGREEPFLTKLLSSGAIMDTMYVMVLCSFSFSTILATFIWLRFRRQLFFSWFLIGFGKWQEQAEIFKRYSRPSGAGFLAGLATMAALSLALPDIHLSVSDIFLAFGITLGLGGVILFSCYAYYRRKL